MNQNTALAKGYHSTGIFSFDKDEVTLRCAEIRRHGYKALVVTVPADPLSRGHNGGGYAVVVELRYLRDAQAKDILQLISRQPAEISALQAQHAKQLEEVRARHAANEKWLVDNGYSASQETAPVATPAVPAGRDARNGEQVFRPQ